MRCFSYNALKASITVWPGALLACFVLLSAAIAGEPSNGLTGAAQKQHLQWKSSNDLETTGWLPASVAYSANGKTIVAGGTEGHVVALDSAARKEKWKAAVGNGVAAVAFSADQNSIVATFKDGLRFLDADSGKLENTIDEVDSRPTVVGVFPDQVVVLDQQRLAKSHKIICGNARGYFVKIWIDPLAVSSINTSTQADGQVPADPTAVPLAVDPAGKCVIVTGPINQETGRNVLWAWVAGNYEKDSPGNRLLEGHEAAAVSAAWSKDGKTAATGDAAGRIILWDALTMKESNRLEFDGRIAALALSKDGKTIAAAVVGEQAEFYIWEAGQPRSALAPIYIDRADFAVQAAGSIQACLTFSPDGRFLAGSAINLAWLSRTSDLVGTLHFWERVD